MSGLTHLYSAADADLPAEGQTDTRLQALESFPWRTHPLGLSSSPVSVSHLYWFAAVVEEIVVILTLNLGSFSVFCALTDQCRHILIQKER